MKEAVKKTLQKMDSSDLNLEIWGGLFRNIIESTGGGEKEATIQVPYPVNQNDPRALMAFIQHYLGRFGMNTHISMRGDELTYHPHPEK